MESNHRHEDLQSSALPTELYYHFVIHKYTVFFLNHKFFLSFFIFLLHVFKDSNSDHLGWSQLCYHYTKDIFAPPVGFEPTTFWLTVRCSTTKLWRQILWLWEDLNLRLLSYQESTLPTELHNQNKKTLTQKELGFFNQ